VFRRLRVYQATGEALPPPTAAERLETGLRHLSLMVEDVGSEVAAREMRKHVAWYVRGLPHSARVREQVNRTRGVEEMQELLRSYLRELGSRPAAPPAEVPLHQPEAGRREAEGIGAAR
jgi:tRNA-dihydrouridine synthase B